MSKILLVEDDSALLSGLKYSLEKEGFDVAAAGSVKQGETLFSEGSFSLVMLDVGLPDGTGFDLCRIIRQSSEVPVLFLTACDEEVNVVMGLDMGGDEYITKPFRLRELISRIQALLRRAEANKRNNGQSAGEIRSSCLRLSTAECRLYGKSGEIPITPAEFRLLQVLMSNPGRTLTRTQLLDRLWDSGGDFVDANTLTVYIRRLREKIEEKPSDPLLIQTVRGVGYKWGGTSDS